MLCKFCNIEKNPDQFYKGQKSKCKDCTCERVRKNRLEKIDQYTEYEKSRATLEHRVNARKAYMQTGAGKESHKKSLLKNKITEPHKAKARNAVSNAIRDGRLIRQPCFICGEYSEAHHADYSRPLDVVWLCNKHHREAHDLIKDMK